MTRPVPPDLGAAPRPPWLWPTRGRPGRPRPWPARRGRRQPGRRLRPGPRRRGGGRPPGPPWTTGPAATSRPGWPAPSWPTSLADLAARVVGREAGLGSRRRLARPGRAVRRRLPRPGWLASLCGRAGPPPPRARLRAGARDLPPLRRGEDPPARRARPPRPTRTSPRRSSPDWPSSAASGCRCPRSTAGSPPAARATTWAWWWPPRSSAGARSASAARSSPGPRS